MTHGYASIAIDAYDSGTTQLDAGMISYLFTTYDIIPLYDRNLMPFRPATV